MATMINVVMTFNRLDVPLRGRHTPLRACQPAANVYLTCDIPELFTM